MFSNYLKIAFRNLWKYPVFSAINILGLAIAMSAAMVVYLLVDYDFSFDKFHKDGDRIYRIIYHSPANGLIAASSTTALPHLFTEAIKKDIPGIESVYPITLFQNASATIPKQAEQEASTFTYIRGIIFVAPAYFELVKYDWLIGSAAVLKTPNQVVLTEKQAKKYFPKHKLSEIAGRQIIYNDTLKTTIGAIVADLKENTDFHFTDFIAETSIPASLTLKKHFSWNWIAGGNYQNNALIKISAASSPEKITEQLNQLYKKLAANPGKFSISLQPLADFHFNEEYNGFYAATANKKILHNLLALAAFLLLLGCANFINLTTAQASQRAKEIGIRKTMGSSRVQLMAQFLTETFLLTLIATLLAFIFIPYLLQFVDDYVPGGFYFKFTNPQLYSFAIILLLAVTFLAGFYPALVLTRFKPIITLKKQVVNGNQPNAAPLRKVLTVWQFVLAQVFLLSTLIMVKQIQFMLNKDLGINKDGVVYFWMPNDYKNPENAHRLITKAPVLVNLLKEIPEIEQVSLAGSPPASGFTSVRSLVSDNGGKEPDTISSYVKYGDAAFLAIYNFKLLAGRKFKDGETNPEYIINETYARQLGYKNLHEALGQYLSKSEAIPIVGVVSDFHEQSLRDPIKPLLISNASDGSTMHLLLKPQQPDGEQWSATLKKVENAYKKVYPDQNLSISFFDKELEYIYFNELKTLKLLNKATFTVVFISMLGLLGLVVYTTNQRTKEIGIRKVLGATVKQITFLLSREFLLLVLIAFIIAAPISWYLMHQWLQNFAYKTESTWVVYFLSLFLMLLIAIFTMGFKTMKTAMLNPVKSLRDE
jgi:putative ABC transport system permease protein